MTTDRTELYRLATDPHTDWDTLHWIAENHPELRPQVAQNPSTYPALVEALAELNDPQINAALSRPEQLQFQKSSAPATDGYLSASELLGGEHSGEFDDEHESDPYDETDWEQAAVAYDRGPDPDGKRRSRPGVVFAAVVLPLVAIVAAAFLVWNFVLNGSSTPTAEPEPRASDLVTPAPDEETEPEEEEPEQEPEVSPDEARAALTSLPAESTCDSPQEDAEPFIRYTERVSTDGTWPDSEDQWRLEEVLEGLQDQCSNTHAAATYLELTEVREGPSLLQESLQEVGTGWLDTSFPADAYQSATSFSSPDGNVYCEMAEAVRCSVTDFSFNAPDECDETATFAIYADEEPGPECDNPASTQSQQVLNYGQTNADGIFACSSFRSQMSCWNQLTGEGFNIQTDIGSTY